MSTVDQPGRSFADALSAFWPSFFRDYQEVRGYYEGARINYGQLYLELLQSILGTSLKEMPLYDRRYFKLLEIRRDQSFYQEGAAPEDDRYVYGADSEVLAGAARVANRVLRPTKVLYDNSDYQVKNGAIGFREDYFATPVPGFPINYRDVVHPVRFRTPLNALEAKVGDTFRLRVLGMGNAITARVVGVEDKDLFLNPSRPEFFQDFSVRPTQFSVVRRPFNDRVVGEPVPAHPGLTAAYKADTITGTNDVDFTLNFEFLGTWAATTAYTIGDLVNVGAFTLYRARRSHFSGVVFDPTQWDAVVGMYLYVISDNPANDGYYKIIADAALGRVTLDRPFVFGAVTGIAATTMVSYSGLYTAGAKPVMTLDRTVLTPGTVRVTARRAHPVAVPVVRPAGEVVVEGVDYRVDYENGTLEMLTGWLPVQLARADYQWQRLVDSQSFTPAGVWTTLTPYAVGDVVTVSGVAYVCITADPGSVSFDASLYAKYAAPFAKDVQRVEPTLGMWLVDALVDHDALFANFGFMLDFKKPTNEQYRTFLRGVSQLFLLGPALGRFESALNSMAGYPVVQEDDELLLAYDDGVHASGVAGAVTDSVIGIGGSLDGVGYFTAPTAGFLSTDVGAALRVREGLLFTTYTVVAVLNSTLARVTPPPPLVVDLQWQYEHVAINRRFATDEYLFTDADVGALLTLPFGTFPIAAIEASNAVTLDAPFGFRDATGLAWSLSRTGRQTVTTSRATYELPLGVLMRAPIIDPASVGTLRLKAFEPFSDAFQVVDYVEDPTWWHNVSIPEEVLQQIVEAGGRRHVTPRLIEHVYGALDTAVYGDVGVAYGVDDEGEPGVQRAGQAIWFGGDSLVLNFAAGVPTARINDVGQHLSIRSPGFEGFFPVRTVAMDGVTIQLDRFPPPESVGRVPPLSVDVELPPLLYRHTVAFVMMDRFLKYHAVRVRIDKSAKVPSAFVSDVTRLLKEAKPAHTYIYFDSFTEFRDIVRLVETFSVTFGPLYDERIRMVYASLVYGPPALPRYNDAYRYTVDTQSFSGVPGVYAIVHALPVGDVESNLVKFRFDPAIFLSTVPPRRPEEGLDYLVNTATNTVAILSPDFPVGPNLSHFLYCVRRIRLVGDPLDPTETHLVYGGADPTTRRAPGQLAYEMGFLDRAVQITLGP